MAFCYGTWAGAGASGVVGATCVGAAWPLGGRGFRGGVATPGFGAAWPAAGAAEPAPVGFLPDVSSNSGTFS